LPSIRTDQGGFTIVESLVAMVLVVGGLLAVVSVFAHASAGVHTGEREAQATAVAERALEQLLARPYAELANCKLSGEVPVNTTGSTGVDDPTSWVSPGSAARLLVKSNYKVVGSGSAGGVGATGEPFVFNESGSCRLNPTTDGTGVIAGPLPVTSASGSRLTGWKIFRFITWYDDHCGGSLGTDPATLGGQVDGLISGLLGTLNSILRPMFDQANILRKQQIGVFCGSLTDAKRITIAVVAPRLADGAGPALPVYLSAMVPDPNAGTGINTGK
jgi:type II secretory pathway pseudopilin PulG